MTTSNCEKYGFRSRYDRNPRSILGRLWKWHANWCPGWKAYMRSLADEERLRLADKYDLRRYK